MNIFIDSYNSFADFTSSNSRNNDLIRNFVDDRIINSRHPMLIPGFCTVCNCVTSFFFEYSGLNNGSAHPAWTETGVCKKCDTNSRSRAIFTYLLGKLGIDKLNNSQIYLAEQTTPFFFFLKSLNKNLIGSEYLGDKYASGFTAEIGSDFVLHQDLTNLSFESSKFDTVITRDVFEHIPNYISSFAEIYRVLKIGGNLIFTVPFSSSLPNNVERARILSDGHVEHILPPEIHGNPIDNTGSLCFHNFGWEMLNDLKSVGFGHVLANQYWSPLHGHLGQHFFVFSAIKT